VPWKETCAMEERVRFVHELETKQLSMAELCRRYGISRRTGYKWAERYAQDRLEGLRDRSRARKHQPHAVSEAVEAMILEARAEHPTWGPRKLRAWLAERHPRILFPALSTIGALLKRHGLTVARRRRRRCEPYTQPFADCDGPNRVWCADFKGWFRTGDGQRCEPLTITDGYSRYLLRCQALPRISYEAARGIFEACFRQYGLPQAIRTDNGAPFSSTAVAGLSRLAVWWIKLGITPERIAPGKPQQNGRHERMHLTLKRETASPPAQTLRGQQRVFDRFQRIFNDERPHQALNDQTPASLYEPSPIDYPAPLHEMTYEPPMNTRKIQCCGEFHWAGKKVFLSEALVGETVGFEPVDERYWILYFAHLPLARFDAKRLQIIRIHKQPHNAISSPSPSGEGLKGTKKQ
jgi:putative transposase